MKNKKKPILKIILGIFATLVIIITGILIYSFKETAKSEEMWAFRETLDDTYFLAEDAVMSCIFEGDLENAFSCKKADINKKIEDTKLRVSSYVLKNEDSNDLRKIVMENVTVIEDILRINAELDPENKDTFVPLSNELFDKKKKLMSNRKKIIDILDKYYD
ncbi:MULTISPECIES: hypothetical protein [unclassified Bacillus (in: firmicutes)]|uniref:hypothetical protein n=1 Tax=unclassified Bacillus (in: firmicutes) TaxID=185979 RepID=UPI0008E56063|nr:MULTISPECIES: hypothetical protein [unclassified Bacillus (in: firmicutes)]SFB19597.1 hypothetical protein SAMN02799634_10812 [Bacillus sp. UNCCL13]SFQ90700.1 hypothetical protein SAMN04488577_3828 [Bacillus sp. cl95]